MDTGPYRQRIDTPRFGYHARNGRVQKLSPEAVSRTHSKECNARQPIGTPRRLRHRRRSEEKIERPRLRDDSQPPSSASSASNTRTPPSPELGIEVCLKKPTAPREMLEPSAPPAFNVLRPVRPPKEMINHERRRCRKDGVGKIDKSLFGKKKFHQDRDFVIVVDKSSSMNAIDRCSKTGEPNKRWGNARNAIKRIVRKACKYDEDGITLYLFSDDVVKYENVDSGRRVVNIFNETMPKGSTNLTSVLNAAFAEHFAKLNRKTRPTTMLILTDGVPDCEKSVKSIIQRAANLCFSATELSLSFIQIGNDKAAHNFLKSLDDDLLCKYDIVDTITDDCLQSKLSFEELIYLSVMD